MRSFLASAYREWLKSLRTTTATAIAAATTTNTKTSTTTSSEGQKSEIYHAHYSISHRQRHTREQLSCPAGTQERTTFAL